MTQNLGSVVGRLSVIDSDQQSVPFIDVVGESHELVPVPNQRYSGKADEVVREVNERDNLLVKTGSTREQEGDITIIGDLGQYVKPGDPNFPNAVAGYCLRHELLVKYEPNE